MSLVEQGAPALDLPPIDSSEVIEDGSSEDSFEQEAEFSNLTLFELEDDFNLDLREGEESYPRAQTVEKAELDMSEHGSSQAQAAISKQGGQTGPEYTDNGQRATGEFHSPEPAATFTEPVSEGLFDDHLDRPQSSEQAAVTDPWEDPLPAWDRSQNEWPVLMGPPRRSPFGVLRATLIALVFLAAAGFYFFILQPTLGEQRTSVPADSKGAERAAAAAQPNASESKPAEPDSHPGLSSPSSEPPAAVDPRPTQVSEDVNTGMFSLQAASFPNQAGAEEFAEKLKRAGVPSYTVSADLGRRGRWFRVRVGRFNSAEDAQKFAAEAQLRARAAGMSLQLIACQYDQP
jgi:cell division septation protein DedD